MDYRIKELCKKKGILFKELAKQIGITDVGLRQSLQGNPTMSTLEKIANVLNVNVSDLLKEQRVLCDNSVYGFASIHGEVKEFKSADELKDIAEKL